MKTTTKTTTRKTNKLKRNLTAAMAAVMMMTTAASVMASAADVDNVKYMNTNVSISMVSNATAGKEFNEKVATELAVDVIFEGIKEFVPGGKTMMPVLRLFADDLMGKGKPLTLNDINAKLDDLFENIDDLNSKIAQSTENIAAIQNFTNCQYYRFNSQIKEIVDQVQSIRANRKLSENRKLAQIGALIGNSFSWTGDGSVIISFRNFVSAVNRPNLSKNETLFETIYNHNKRNAMFSGEALDMSAEANELIMKSCYAGYLALIECMSAQLKVCNMTDEQRAEIPSCELDKITGHESQDIIRSRIEEFTKLVLGKKYETNEYHVDENGKTVFGPVTKYDDSGISGKYKNLYKTNRLIFVNKGNGKEIQLSPKLTVTNTSGYQKGEDGAPMIRALVDDINSKIVPKMKLNGDQIRAIAAYIKGRNITMREYLKANGFDVDKLPKHALIITEKAYHNEYEAGEFAKAGVGFEDWRTFVKCIDVDVKNPSQEEVHVAQYYHKTIFYWNTKRYDKDFVTFNKD